MSLIAILCPQIDVVFAKGDLFEVRKAVEAMEAAGLEAVEARYKLTRVEEAMKKVRRATRRHE